MSKEKNPAVSVIIPMYNAEKYIGECLQSLLNQTLKNFEVVVVDDCSTDNSVAIVEKYFSERECGEIIRLSVNSGCPGIPRNFGLDIAKGKYVYFMDSDDFLSEDALEIFYNVAENFNAEIVEAEVILKHEEGTGKFEPRASRMIRGKIADKPTLEILDIAKKVDNILKRRHSNAVWNKLFRRDFLIENKIKFPAMTITEDFVFTFQCIVCAKNFVRIPFIGYFYRIYIGSTSKTLRDIKTASLDFIEGVYCLDNFMKSKKFFIENSKYQYLVIDLFDQWFSNKIFKGIFFDMNFGAEETYDFYCRDVFSENPKKNIPLSAYLFVSTNIYKLLVKQQAEEIARLKKNLEELCKEV